MFNEMEKCPNCHVTVWSNGNLTQCPRCGNRLVCDVCGERFEAGETQKTILALPKAITGHIDCIESLSGAAPAPAAEPSLPPIINHAYTLHRAQWPGMMDVTSVPGVAAREPSLPPPTYEDWEQPPPQVDTEGNFTDSGDEAASQQEPELAPAVADYLRELGLL